MIYLSTALSLADDFISGSPSWWYGYGFKFANNPPSISTLNTLASMYPSTYTSSYITKVKNKINAGYYLIDCSGLVCHCLNITDIGSTQIGALPSTNSTYTTDTVANVQAGDILWKSGHVAIAIDSTYCVEARGIDYGVVKSKISSRSFTKVVRPTYYYYENVGWNQDSTGWWYAYGQLKGEYYANTTAWIDGKLYAFDAEGYMVYNPDVYTDSDGAIVSITGARASEL